jgi:hypothetical protein
VTDPLQTIARWARGEEPDPHELVALALISEAQPGALDGPLAELTAIRSRALIRRLRELAGEALPEHEALSELADRIEELLGPLILPAEQELALLSFLVAEGAQSERQLACAADGVDEQRIGEWALDAADRGLIEQVEPGSPIRRWHVTERGLAVLER